ncbi:hypothetical protein TI39_contig5854g00002 [Zymoseptoria brevis]|uniref:Uncharacterized protein n=1 Tax=Zymoseptoria brevis TaxID=1047168 RepID=A0A0F4G5W2_9PEZI|nr:hypothetical protein TI39_contig5854g00002 [Zymoseptoria brevis]
MHLDFASAPVRFTFFILHATAVNYVEASSATVQTRKEGQTSGASFILYEHGRASEAQIEAMDTTEMMSSSRWFEEFRRVSECIRDLRLDPTINISSGMHWANLNLIKEYVVRPAEWESTLGKLQKAADLATTEWDELGNLGLKDNEGRRYRDEAQDSPFREWLADPARKDRLKGELRSRAESFPR